MTTDGEPYLVMEWVEGLGLNYLIETKSPQLKGNRINYLPQLCDAVQYLHAQKFLHRDLCPRNVMVDQGRAGQADRLRADDPVHPGRSASRATAPARPTTWPRRSSSGSRPTTGWTCSPWG